MINDLLLIRRVKEGDIKAFETIFRKFYSPLVYYSHSITGRSDVAEDIIQDLFYTLWKEREKIEVYSSLKNYLYGAVRNRSLQFCERRKLDDNYKTSLELSPGISDPGGPQESVEFLELENIILKSLERMPQRRVEIFKLHRFKNKKYKEIADSLSLSVKTVEAEMTKALKTIRKEIELHTFAL